MNKITPDTKKEMIFQSIFQFCLLIMMLLFLGILQWIGFGLYHLTANAGFENCSWEAVGQAFLSSENTDIPGSFFLIIIVLSFIVFLPFIPKLENFTISPGKRIKIYKYRLIALYLLFGIYVSLSLTFSALNKMVGKTSCRLQHFFDEILKMWPLLLAYIGFAVFFGYFSKWRLGKNKDFPDLS